MGWSLPAALFTAALALAPSCSAPAERPELEPLPEAELSAFEETVRAQLGDSTAKVEEALQQGDDVALTEAWGELGRHYHAYELHEAAAVAYRNALLLSPGSFRWLYHLGILSQATGELDEAARLLQRALQRRPGDLPARVRLGEIFISQGDADAAREELERALEQDPRCALAHFFLGNLANGAGDRQEAIRRYERTLELQPKASAVHSPLAVAYQALGEGERAEFHLARRGRQVVQLLDSLALELGELHVGAVGRIRRGARAQIEGNLALAREEYLKAVAADPTNPEARQSLGTVHALLGDSEAAIAEYRATLEITGDTALALANLGGVLVTTVGGRDEGIRHLERALELEPTLANAHLALGQMRLEEARPEEAERHYRAILERDVSNLAARLGLARALAAVGDSAQATAELKAALDRDPAPGDAAVIHQELASLAAGARDLAGALDELEQALTLDPTLTMARFSRANLLGIAGRYGEAAAEYRQVLAAQPSHVPAYLGQATALVMAGEYAEAGRALTDGIGQTDSDPQLLHALAQILVTAPEASLRDPQRALDLSNRALQAHRTLEVAATRTLALAAIGRCVDSIDEEHRLYAEARRTHNEALVRHLQPRLRHCESTGSCLEPWRGAAAR